MFVLHALFWLLIIENVNITSLCQSKHKTETSTQEEEEQQQQKSRAPAPLWYVFDPSFLRRPVSLIEIAPPKHTSRQSDRRSITALQLVDLSSSAHLRVAGVNSACPYLIHRHHLPSSVIINFKSSN